ncbi:nicotinic acetylcholine receptor subunit beta [Citrobacter freundii]|uniref:nicotinic acetylcholine receptor subunit beta n=1 Tax=Citrobacter freundii TaxID=546 RepID=UPI003B24392E
MNINLLYRHPAENDVDAMLSCEHAYPDSFSLAERTAERMTRARLGISHVMTELLPKLEEDHQAELYCWLDKVLLIVEVARIDAEGEA